MKRASKLWPNIFGQGPIWHHLNWRPLLAWVQFGNIRIGVQFGNIQIFDKVQFGNMRPFVTVEHPFTGDTLRTQ